MGAANANYLKEIVMDEGTILPPSNVLNVEFLNACSELTLKDYTAKDNCSSCLGRGVMAIQYAKDGNYDYRPCSCLKKKIILITPEIP